MIQSSATISGDGVAALTLARLLAGQGWRINLLAGATVRPLHLLLSTRTAALISALWDDPALLADGHAIAEREVHWSGAALADEAGVVVAAETLVARLSERLRLPPAEGGDTQWSIDARPGSPLMQRFGRRQGWISSTSLRAGADAARSIIVRLPDGWLFLLPLGGGKASLQWIGTALPTGNLLAKAPQIEALIADVGDWSQPVPAMPRAHPSPAGPGRLMVGEAALGFDPLSGDGVGHALRGAILAATTLTAIADGAHEAEALHRYEATLKGAMAQHLKLCLGHYGEGFTGPGWEQEIAAMQTGYLMANTS